MAKRIDLDKQKLIELRDQGKTRQEIAEYFSVTPAIVSNNVKRYGIQMDRKIVLDIIELKQLFDQGMSHEQMSKYFNVDKAVIRRNLRENNLTRTTKEIRANTEQHLKEKYGDDLSSYYADIRQRAFETWQKNTGLENPYCDQEMIEKRKNTCKTRYGCVYPTQSEEVKDKIKNTNNQRYGGNTPMSSMAVKEKTSKTYYDRTGYTNPSLNPEVVKKRKQTCEKLYGTPNYSQKDWGEKAKAVLLSRETMEEYLKACGLNTTSDIAQDLGVSNSTIVKTAAKFNLKGYAIVNSSKGEQELREFVESLGVKTIHAKGTVIEHLDIDVYCCDYKIGIEYNGTYWHSDLRQPSRLYHYDKSKACEEKGIRLIHVYSDEWEDPVKQNIVKSLIKIALGKVESRIYARECEVREISNKEARPFNEANHIQGHRNAKITYGLFYKDTLVQLMSFSWNSHYQAWEIIRGCPGSNNIVVGGVSKLFKHFIKEHNPDRIFSYCDYNKFNGVGYEAIGMKYIGETKYNKWYVINGKRYERNPKKYKLYSSIQECTIWGAGSKKYLWEREPEDK